ncbi:filamin-C-like [Physella acuta]|uniref:filamin-C-like n=1 Tax=Physella acuta TaxID=109671 RepID=UPI0027DB42A8|nr:filamin-C-like [Physella acuta]XP_059151968.1 filamin-C-like [Physella acuta]
MENEMLTRHMTLTSRNMGDWLQIQKNTFTNWVNETLRDTGVEVQELRTDLSDGVRLVALIESLTGHRISGTVSKPSNEFQKLQNITISLEAVKTDGVKIVNIDSSDVLEGNQKLVLALIWQLILKYQIGLSAKQNKTWLLKWLKAVIPESDVQNLTTDWNSGLALHSLLEFCKAGLAPGWRELDQNNKLENCSAAMRLAQQNFNIPVILRAEDLASPDLDEKSTLTYLSYFTRVGGPGYDATLQRIAARTQPKVVTNFTSDWRDGEALYNLVCQSGGQIKGEYKTQGTPLELTLIALESGRHLGVEPLLTGEQIVEAGSGHLGMMAYTAQYLSLPHVATPPHGAPYSLPHRLDDHRTHNGEHSQEDFRSGNNDITMVNHTHYSEYKDMKPLKVTTFEDVDEIMGSHTAILKSPKAPTTFHLIRKSSFHAPHVELPPVDQLKVDTYSVGVIMESRMPGAFNPEKFRVEAVAPSGRVIKITGDGHYAAQFNADEIGRWKVSMFYENRFLDGCPIEVSDPSQVKVIGLQGGHVGKSNSFNVDCTRAGPGDLGVDISHKGRKIVANIVQTSTPGLHKVTFTPYNPGAYEINVHFNRAEIRESEIELHDPSDRTRKAVFYTHVDPQNGYVDVKAACDWEVDYLTGVPFICHVTDASDISVYSMEDGTVCLHPQLIADCTRVGEGRIDADVTYQGLRYPCRVKQDKPCVYKVSFKPQGPGVYKVWINYDGQPVKGSPFIQEISELEKPSANGDGLYRGVPGAPATFTVDPRGFPGQVSVSVIGPSKPVSSQLEPLADQTVKATYVPTERGPHQIDIKLDNKHIEGSPFKPLIVDPVKVRVSGGWKPYLDDKGVIPLKVNKEKHLPFDVSEAGPGELTAQVQGPNGKIPVAIDARQDGKHSVVFTPREEGRHNIHVSWCGYPLSNSPYLGFATREPELDEPAMTRIIPVAVPVADSYPSPRSSVFDGPSHIAEPEFYKPGNVVYQPEGRVQVLPVTYTAPPPKRYIEHAPADVEQVEPPKRYIETKLEPRLKLDQETLPSPNTFPKHTSSSRSSTSSQANSVQPKPQKVILSGKGLKEAEVGKPATFKVDGRQAEPGKPTAHLEGVRANIPVTSEPIEPQRYKCEYVPEKPGAYLLYVDWNNKPLKGSPFKVTIREPSKPHKVTTSGEPLGAVMGRDLEMRIDPREAGPGQLTVSCTDPNGRDVPCSLKENIDGTRSLKVTPKMAGRHIVDIRYDGAHILGSPYAIDIKESQVKGKVKVWGPGVENGIIPNFQSTFWVETTGAGAGDLRVRIIGPKGAFHVKMRKASTKERIYQCFYDPVEPGIYTVNVEWSGSHVDGSPFTVLLATSARELRALQGDVLDVSGDTESVLHRSQRSNGQTMHDFLY